MRPFLPGKAAFASSGVANIATRAIPLVRSNAKVIEASSRTVLLIPISPFFSGMEERRVSDPRPITQHVERNWRRGGVHLPFGASFLCTHDHQPAASIHKKSCYIGPELCELLRTPYRRTPQNISQANVRLYPVPPFGALSG